MIARWASAALGLALAAPAGAAITEDHFQLRNGADLVAVCSAAPGDPLYTAAIHLCQGFGVGEYQTIQAMTTRRNEPPVLCPPDPVPSRNQTLAAFLDWARLHPERQSEPAVEFLGRFLIDRFGCKQ